MKKLVYISSIAAPHQIKLCSALNEHIESEFWFYDTIGERASWWEIPLGDKCKILDSVLLKKNSKFITFQHLSWLSKYDPDIVMLGGFSIPANYLAYQWAKWRGKRTIVFTERSRDKSGKLRKMSFIWRLLKWLYRNVDMVMTSEKDIVSQFRDEFQFGNKVVAARYASDIEPYLKHYIRTKKKAYTYMFPNRLIDIYNPLTTIRIFHEIYQLHPSSQLVMNAIGELRGDCEKLITTLGIKNNVEFLDNINTWNELNEQYERCDIMIFPAKFSNGNFTIIEAMASGMGIIISDRILGIGNYIVNGVNGFRIPVDNHLFIEKIEKYIHEPSLFEKHSILNRKKVAHFGVDETAKLYYELISKLFD